MREDRRCPLSGQQQQSIGTDQIGSKLIENQQQHRHHCSLTSSWKLVTIVRLNSKASLSFGNEVSSSFTEERDSIKEPSSRWDFAFVIRSFRCCFCLRSSSSFLLRSSSCCLLRSSSSFLLRSSSSFLLRSASCLRCRSSSSFLLRSASCLRCRSSSCLRCRSSSSFLLRSASCLRCRSSSSFLLRSCCSLSVSRLRCCQRRERNGIAQK